jgi:hypoxanthine phosphoribosyltransferase
LVFKAISAQEAWEVLQNADCLYEAAAVEAALDSMVSDITQALANKNPLVVCIMQGGVVPFGKLLPKLQFPLQIDYVHVSRYREKLHGGKLDWIVGPKVPARNRNVLLVDDILDEGTTLSAIEDSFLREGAKEVYKAVLIVKKRLRAQEIKIDFAGLEVPNRYVFGYGMDYKGYLRNAPGIYAKRKNS